MRICDWSSDVCSSDLQISRDANRDLQGTLAERDEEIAGLRADVAFYERFVGATGQRRGLTVHQPPLPTEPARDRKSVAEGKRVSARVDLCGRRISTKKNQNHKPTTNTNCRNER